MEAGRELDALVAEKVMGHKCSCGVEDSNNRSNPYGIKWFCLVHGATDIVGGNYSTNIADAWEVVNHLMCLGYDDKWFFQLHYDNVELWDASFYKESTSDGGGPEVWGTADTPALAICLAALRAKGVTGEQHG